MAQPASPPPSSSYPRFEWSSLEHQVDSGEDETEDEVVRVPYSGVYSVAFGRQVPILCASKPSDNQHKKKQQPRKRKRGNQKDRNEIISNAQKTVELDQAAESAGRDRPVVAHLVIRPPPSESREANSTSGAITTTSVTQRLPLPWHDDLPSDDPPLMDPPSIFLAKLLWIEADSLLSMEWAPTEHDGNVNKADALSRQQRTQWHVRLHFLPSRKNQTNPATTLTFTAPKRCWVCTICKRGFLSGYRVGQHQIGAHYEQIMSSRNVSSPNENIGSNDNDDCDESSSIWTTPLDVAYNDDYYLAVVVKPQGMPIMGDVKGPNLWRSPLLLALRPSDYAQRGKTRFLWPTLSHLSQSGHAPPPSPSPSQSPNPSNKDEQGQWDSYLGKPRPVHRLDGPTGGLLVIAKTSRVDAALRQAFADRACHKVYWALVHGRVEEDEGTCSEPLGGKPSTTHYRVLQRSRSLGSRCEDGWLTTVECVPTTGRMHQIRKHMQLLGHPLWGDKRYGVQPRKDSGSKKKEPSRWERRLCLWAIAIRFTHPVTQREVSCRMDNPTWLQQVVDHEAQAWCNVHGGKDTDDTI